MTEAIDILKSIDGTLKEMLAIQRSRRAGKPGAKKPVDYSPDYPCTKCFRQETCNKSSIGCSKLYAYENKGAA